VIRWALTKASTIVFHNSVYDVPNLYLNGLFKVEWLAKLVDTIIYSRMAVPSDIGGHDLFAIGSKYAGLTGENHLLAAFKMLGLSREKGFELFDLDRPVYLQGAAADVIVTARIHPVVRQAAYDQITTNHPFGTYGVSDKEAWRLVDRDQIVNRVLLARTCKGLPVDLEYLDTYRQETSVARREAEAELDKLGIKAGDGNSLTSWLEDNGALPADHPRTAKTNKASATAKDLEGIDHPIAKLFVTQKKIAKIENDYLLKTADLSLNIDGVDRVFPVTSVLKAATGRAAMADPPLHQFNGPARGIIVADPGDSLTSIDWAAIEPCIISNLAGESSVFNHYETWYPDKKNRDTGELGTYGDVYEGIGELAGVVRKTAKIVLLAGLYGEGITKLSVDLKTTVDDARSIQAQLFATMPRIKELIDTIKQNSRRYHCIMTLSGRIIPVPFGTYDGERSIQAHKGVNYTVQGGAYDVLSEAVVACYEAGLGDAIYFTMHDELVVSTDAAHDIRKIMETPPERLCMLSGRTPMLRTDSAEMGYRWKSV
jgi:DNA polymerase-1